MSKEKQVKKDRIKNDAREIGSKRVKATEDKIKENKTVTES